ncbi:MAG: hypothetical protein ACLQVM_25960, partial [Terriglobia bacterium]
SRACGTVRGAGPTKRGGRDFGGAETPPFRQHFGGVAPGYSLVPLQSTKNLPLGLTPQHPFLSSRVAVFGYGCPE